MLRMAVPTDKPPYISASIYCTITNKPRKINMFGFKKNTQPLLDEINKKLISRLDGVQLKPQTILLLDNSQQKVAYKLLKKHYPKARIIEDKTWLHTKTLPLSLPDNPIDFIYANLALSYFEKLEEALRELRRILKPQGLLLFSSLGPDTFKEWLQAWVKIGVIPEVYGLHDILDLGNALTQAGFTDPVLDVDRLEIRYKELATLIKELKQHGLRFQGKHWPHGLITPRKFEQLKRNLSHSISLELVFGHAWKPEPKQEHIGNEIHIPLETFIKKK